MRLDSARFALSVRDRTLFCTRGTERHMVSITPTDPRIEHKYGASHLTESPGCGGWRCTVTHARADC
jgi:hypothetical protein